MFDDGAICVTALPVCLFARMHGRQAARPWHFLYFLPEPQGQGSWRPPFLRLPSAAAPPACAPRFSPRPCLPPGWAWVAAPAAAATGTRAGAGADTARITWKIGREEGRGRVKISEVPL